MSGRRFPYQNVTCKYCGHEAKYETKKLLELTVVCEGCEKNIAYIGRCMLETDEDSRNDLGSLDCLEMIINIEDYFGVELEDEDVEPFRELTINKLCYLINQKLENPVANDLIIEQIHKECKSLDIEVHACDSIPLNKAAEISYRLKLLADLCGKFKSGSEIDLEESERAICIAVCDKLLPLVKNDEVSKKQFNEIFNQFKKVKTISVLVFKLWIILRRLGLNSGVSMPDNNPWHDD